jgi:hypothetical protein
VASATLEACAQARLDGDVASVWHARAVHLRREASRRAV